MAVKSVLVIEPDHNNRVLVRTALERVGHFVLSTTGGAAALALLEQTSTPGLILLSSNLPFMAAGEFLALLRKNPKWSAIPVAQFLGDADLPLAGICCTIRLPIDPQALLKAVETA